MPPRRSWVWFALILLLNYFLARGLFPSADADALLKRETLGQEEILKVTGLPPAPPLETNKLPV